MNLPQGSRLTGRSRIPKRHLSFGLRRPGEGRLVFGARKVPCGKGIAVHTEATAHMDGRAYYGKVPSP